MEESVQDIMNVCQLGHICDGRVPDTLPYFTIINPLHRQRTPCNRKT